jgi:putative N6-adenine-specific DNA methylase
VPTAQTTRSTRTINVPWPSPYAARVHDCLAVCPPGLEPLLADELRSLSLRPSREIHGGVPFRATDRELYLANAWTRLATRIVVRAGTFVARSFADLERRGADLPWPAFLAPGISPVFRVSSTGSTLYHTDAIAERLHRVTGTEPLPAGSPEATDPERVQLVVVRVARDKVTVSFDSSGDSLHRRGWRQEVAKAPLRETLAAAMVRAAGWSGSVPFVDPMCGSGTIAIEAALAAAGLAPGAHRSFAFQRWPSFKPGTWASVNAGITAAERATERRRAVAPILAADRDEGAARAAAANAERAGVADLVVVRAGALSVTAAAVARGLDRPGLVLTNPPYGERVGGSGRHNDLRDLYASIGGALRGPLAGWSLGLLVADRSLAAQTGLSFEERFATSNGGIPVSFLLHERTA